MRPTLLAFVLCLLVLLFGPPARAQQAGKAGPSAGKPPGFGLSVNSSSAPAVLKADRVSYDEDLGIVVASGHVEVSQNDRVLIADTVTYNQRADMVTASGNISLLQPGGDVVFADYIELTQGLKNGVIQNFRLLMADHSRIAAAGARRSNGGNLTEMVNAVYSSCDLCKRDPTRAPLWQVKAANVTHDDTEHEIQFEDATIEMGGIPIAYTPYMSMPDPTVKRKSGLLAPTYGVSTQLGTLLKVPYFQTLGDDKDVTFAPILTTKGNAVFNADYRERWGDGQVDVQGSATDAEAITNGHNDSLGGNINARGVFDINNNWRSGFDVQRETSDTYLSYYKLIYAPTTVLPAHAYAEGFFGRSYSSLDAYAFQDLRSTVDINTLPIVAPWYQYNYVSEPGDYGQRWTVAASALNLETPVGVDSRRLSQRTQWELPYTSSNGQIYTLAMSFETDGYSTSDNVNPNNPTALRSENSAGRALPQVKLDWRYPWVRQTGTIEELIEPHVALIGGPQGRNSFLIPNQDSLDFEVDDSNLYNLNPFPGLDRVDGGERVVYGTSVGAYGSRGGTTNVFLGQIYRPHTDDTFTNYSGLSGSLSDYIGHVQIRPLQDVNLTYRYRLAEKDLTPHSTQLTSTLGPDHYNVQVSYLSVTQEVPGTGVSSVEQILVAPTAALTEHWTATTTTVYNLALNRFSGISASAIYNDECFNMVAQLQRSYAVNGPIQPSTSFLVTLVYKGLGDVRLGGS